MNYCQDAGTCYCPCGECKQTSVHDRPLHCWRHKRGCHKDCIRIYPGLVLCHGSWRTGPS